MRLSRRRPLALVVAFPVLRAGFANATVLGIPGGPVTGGVVANRASRRRAEHGKHSEGAPTRSATVTALDGKTVRAWRALARDAAREDYANKNENSARLIKLAMEVGS